MKDEILRKRQKLVNKLNITGELLRGSLLDRTIRHKSRCETCARGGGHQAFVLNVGYAGGRNRQLSLRPDRVDEVRRRLRNYRELREAIEAICELNLELVRSDRGSSKARKKPHD